MTHFADMSLFAFLVSLVLGFISRRSLTDRVRYTVFSFLGFLLVAIAIGWLMYPFSR